MRVVSVTQKFAEGNAKVVPGGAAYTRQAPGPAKNPRQRATDMASIERPQIQIYKNNQKQEQQAAAGFNVSYDSSFSAIKNNIFNFKGGGPADGAAGRRPT